jgi:hypothetical protein
MQVFVLAACTNGSIFFLRCRILCRQQQYRPIHPHREAHSAQVSAGHIGTPSHKNKAVSNDEEEEARRQTHGRLNLLSSKA